MDTQRAVCAQEAMKLLNCVAGPEFNQEKCLGLLHSLRECVLNKIAEGTKHLPHLWELCTSEIAVRGAKHVLKGLLRETEDHDVGPAIAHFLNCFFGNCQAAATKIGNGKIGNGKSKRGKGRLTNGISKQKTSASYMGMTSSLQK